MSEPSCSYVHRRPLQRPSLLEEAEGSVLSAGSGPSGSSTRSTCGPWSEDGDGGAPSTLGTHPSVAPARAKHVRGRVLLHRSGAGDGGNGKSGKRKGLVDRVVRSHLPGVVVIDVADGGTVSFYPSKDSSSRGFFARRRASTDDSLNYTRRSFLRFGSSASDVRRSPGGDEKTTSVHASTEAFEERPDRKPSVRIPAVIPWEFSVSGEKSFSIVIPPKNDDRMKSIDPDQLAQCTLDLSDEGPTAVVFQCEHARDLAVYSRAAQMLERGSAQKGRQSRRASIQLSLPIASRDARVRSARGASIRQQTSLFSSITGSATGIDSEELAKLREASIGDEERRCHPLYAYPNTWMTKREIALEVPRSSKKFHDMRQGTPEELGSLKVEVLECQGLKKLDRFGDTDAHCWVVCGSAAFVTDIIPDTRNPCWLPLSRRACILPVNNAYTQVFVGVFDDDGEGEADDFAGRVCIDVPQLCAGRQYDVTLPLRQTSRVYRMEHCGSIRLRLQLHWKSEKAALLSYLPRTFDLTKRMKAPCDPVTVACPDAKSFQNVVLTVYGLDVPGRYKNSVKTAATLEIRLIQYALIHHTKRIVLNVVRWESTALSVYFFVAWMYVVTSGLLRHVAAFAMSLVFLLFLRNYLKYYVTSSFGLLHGHITLRDMARILLFDDAPKPSQPKKGPSGLEMTLLRLFEMQQSGSDLRYEWRHENNSEFPFSNGDVAYKHTTEESMADHAPNDTEGPPAIDTRADFDGSDDESAESENVLKSSLLSLASARVGATQKMLGGKTKVAMKKQMTSSPGENIRDDMVSLNTGPKPAPNQDVDIIAAKSDHPIQQQMDRQHSKVQRATLHLFDDRVFLADDKADAERLLRINTKSNPIAKKLNPILATACKILEIFLSSFRAIFNVFMWKDPALSFCFMVVTFCLMIVILVFPWKQFFYLVGIVALGPQNKLLAKSNTDKQEMQGQDESFVKKLKKSTLLGLLSSPSQGEQGQRGKLLSKNAGESGSAKGPKGNRHVGQRDISDSALLHRNNTQLKPDGKKRQVIVPSVPFRHNRFYDWPPDPESTIIKHKHWE